MNTLFLFHFDNNFNDDGDYNTSVSVSGSTLFSNTQSKFGNFSLYFNGTANNKITIHDNTILGTDSFTIEFWLYFISYDAGEGATHILGRHKSGTSSDWLIGIHNTGKLYFGANGTDIVGTTTVALNTWHHVAVTRNGNTFKLFLNGISQGSLTSNMSLDNNHPLTLGADETGNNYMGGYIDELRVIKGQSLYNNNFSIPTTPFSNDACNKTYIQIVIPSGSIPAQYDSICFRVGGLSYCCDPITANTMSNTVCKYIPPPDLPPQPPAPEDPPLPEPPTPEPCLDNDISGFKAIISYDRETCGVLHICNRASFICYINNVSIGNVNLNNANDGKSRTVQLTLPSNIISENNSYKFELRPAPNNTNPHKGIARLQLMNLSGQIVFDACLPNDTASYIPSC